MLHALSTLTDRVNPWSYLRYPSNQQYNRSVLLLQTKLVLNFQRFPYRQFFLPSLQYSVPKHTIFLKIEQFKVSFKTIKGNKYNFTCFVTWIMAIMTKTCIVFSHLSLISKKTVTKSKDTRLISAKNIMNMNKDLKYCPIL